MAEKKTKDSKKPRKLPSRAAVLAVAGAVVSITTTAAVAATVVVARGPLLIRAADLKQTDVKVAFDWPPLAGKSTSRTAGGEPATWMNAEQRGEMERAAVKLLSGNPFDRHALERAQAALKATGWFADGPWLKRFENGVVVISGSWRVPSAAVRTAEGDRLVGPGGEALPVVYPPGRSGLVVLTGVKTAAPALGEKWPGGEVQGGLKLASMLRGLPGVEQLQAVDVSEFNSGKRLSLITTTGGRILWGGPPDEFIPGQAPAATKMQRLAAIYQQFGQLDAGRAELDVRSEDGVYTNDPTAVAEASPGKTGGKADPARAKPGAKNRR